MDESKKIIELLNEFKDKAEYINIQDYDIQDGFYRYLLNCLKYGDDYLELMEMVEPYEKIKEAIIKIEDEKDKTQIITNVSNNVMKLELLKNIKEKENRNLIISSFKRDIDEEIEPYVQCTMKMIKEYFEDSLGDKFSEDKREKLSLAFNRTIVKFEEIKEDGDYETECLGVTDYFDDTISVAPKLKHIPIRILQCLVHEYGHAFSCFDWKSTEYSLSDDIEEGTQDLLSEIVINHFLEKHKEIEINNETVITNYPVSSPSGYEVENGWQRTLLYPLEKSGQSDIALAEYELGDKNKYLEMVLGKEYADKTPKDKLGNPDMTFDIEEIYNIQKSNFQTIDKQSVFYNRNWILPLYILQNKLQDKGVNILDISNGEHIFCKDIANIYFDGKKLYELDKDEFKEFSELILDGKDIYIVDYIDYANDITNNLSDDEIKHYSFEILNMITTVWSELIYVGENLENVLIKCLQREIDKVKEKQDFFESIRKYKEIMPYYIKTFSKKESSKDSLILNYIEYYKFEIMKQLDMALKNEKTKENIISILKKDNDNKIFLDNNILEVLEQNGIEFHTSISVKDVVDSVIRANISIDELTGDFEFTIEEKEIDR